ncbi:MAG: hypothetical protein QM766_02945 [Burkholderiaceae bacterium]
MPVLESERTPGHLAGAYALYGLADLRRGSEGQGRLLGGGE